MTSIFRDGLFAGKVIVVSGGGTGIGRAIARELASLGATVVICSRSVEHLEPTRAEIEAAGGKVTALLCNIRDPEAVSAFFAEVVQRHGKWTPRHNVGGPQPRRGDLAEGLARRRQTNLPAHGICARGMDRLRDWRLHRQHRDGELARHAQWHAARRGRADEPDSRWRGRAAYGVRVNAVAGDY
jgi:citronellol/citronellal dehydrogenase